MKFISIIVPVYNTASLVTRCLQSILKQTYKNFEIIIVDDGSTDGSDEICKEITKKDWRIKYIRINNSGVSVARNMGIEQAKGDFLLFIDSDDYIDNYLLEKIIFCQEKYNCDVVKFSATISNEDNCDIFTNNEDIEIYTSQDALKEYFYGDGTKIKVQIWSGLYKKELFEDIRFPVGKIYEDGYVTPKILARSSKIVFLDYPGYVYYMREGSYMHSTLSNEKIAAYDLYKDIYPIVCNNYPVFKKLIIEKWIFQYIYTYRTIKKDSNYTFIQKKKWYKKIYNELLVDQNFLLQQDLSNSCKRQLKLFLFSPILFNLYIDFVELRGNING